MNVQFDALPAEAGPKEALLWLRGVTKLIGPGFHPDTRAGDYITGDARDSLFLPQQIQPFDDSVGRSMDLVEDAGRDPYLVCLRVQRRLLGIGNPA